MKAAPFYMARDEFVCSITTASRADDLCAVRPCWQLRRADIIRAYQAM